jgi:hypothetical protein
MIRSGAVGITWDYLVVNAVIRHGKHGARSQVLIDDDRMIHEWPTLFQPTEIEET